MCKRDMGILDEYNLYNSLNNLFSFILALISFRKSVIAWSSFISPEYKTRTNLSRALPIFQSYTRPSIALICRFNSGEALSILIPKYGGYSDLVHNVWITGLLLNIIISA